MKDFEQKCVDSLKAAMKDIRSAGAINQMKKWAIRRDAEGVTTPRFYMEDKVTEVADVEAFMDAVTVAECTFEKVNTVENRYNNALAGVKIIPRNLLLRTYPYEDADAEINNIRATPWHNVAFIMEDRNDNDAAIPLKVAYVILVAPDNEKFRGVWE